MPFADSVEVIVHEGKVLYPIIRGNAFGKYNKQVINP